MNRRDVLDFQELSTIYPAELVTWRFNLVCIYHCEGVMFYTDKEDAVSDFILAAYLNMTSACPVVV